jgi:hypothetical protein
VLQTVSVLNVLCFFSFFVFIFYFPPFFFLWGFWLSSPSFCTFYFY